MTAGLIANATDVWNNTGYISLISNLNTYSFQDFGFLFVALIFCIFVYIFKNFGTSESLVLGSLVTTFLTALLVYIGLVPSGYILFMAVLTVVLWASYKFINS